MTFWKWSQTASSNATADSTINWAEGQAPSSVNDSARAMMAAASKYRDDTAGITVTGGTSTAYTWSSAQVFDTLAHLSGAKLTIVLHATNGASPTLNVDSLGGKALNISHGVAPPAGGLLINCPYEVVYSNANSEFIIINGFNAGMVAAASITGTMIGSAANGVQYANMQNVSAGKLLGGNLTNAAAAAPQEITVPFGQCQLVKSGSSLQLNPYKGNLLTINSQACTVPDAGTLTLSTSGLSNTTLYYVYAYMNSSTMTLEAVTTAYATQAGTGIKIKSGDATRTLVGMCYLTGAAFQDTATARYVRSYFNDPGIQLTNAFTAQRSSTSGSYVEINSEIQIAFLAWSGEIIQVEANGAVFNSGANITNTAISFDGAAQEDSYSRTDGATVGGMAVSINKSGLSEGQHYATLFGFVNGGTGSWVGAASGTVRCTLRGYARLS
jgi:hypothetical protein